MEGITKGKRGFFYLKEILKNPDVSGVIVTDGKGNSIYEEVSFNISPLDRREIVSVFKNFNPNKRTICYIFTKDKVVLLSKNPPKFKGVLITFARKTVNLGLLRVYHQKFIDL